MTLAKEIGRGDDFILFRELAPPRIPEVTVRRVVGYLVLMMLCASTVMGQSLSKIADLDVQFRKPLEESFKRFLDLPILEGRDAGDLAWDCLATAELARLGETKAIDKLHRLATQLAAKALPRPTGQLVWGPNSSANSKAECSAGGFKAFGHCNPASTGYSVQSGLAVACLAEAGELLKDERITGDARNGLKYWDAHMMGEVPGCEGCIYYRYDDASVDRGRYVRNVNLIMGYGAAVLATQGHAADAKRLAKGVVKADIWERAGGNRGYLGRLDPEWRSSTNEAQRIEYHSAFVALFSARIGEAINSADAIRHGVDVWRDWAKCANERCYTNTCAASGADATRCVESSTFVHCAFRRLDTTAADMCREVLIRSRGRTLGGAMTFSILSAQ